MDLGERVYCFLGEEIISGLVIEIVDDIRIRLEDRSNTYCVYIKHCYLDKEDAIDGMLNSIRSLTECDCGEVEGQIESLLYRCC